MQVYSVTLETGALLSTGKSVIIQSEKPQTTPLLTFSKMRKNEETGVCGHLYLIVQVFKKSSSISKEFFKNN